MPGRGAGNRGRSAAGRGRGRGGIRRRARGRDRGRPEGAAEEPKLVEKVNWHVNADDCDGAGDGDGAGDEVQFDITGDVIPLFTGTASFMQHSKAQTRNRYRYAAAIVALERNGVELSQNAKVRGLAAAWARSDQDLASLMLAHRHSWGLIEVLKAVTILDSSRMIRKYERDLVRLRMTNTKISAKKLGKIKSKIDNLQKIEPPVGSATGAVCKQVRRWIRGFTKDQLEFFALHMPKEPWLKLADICHPNPIKDFPNLPWFLFYVYGKNAPDDTMVNKCKQLSSQNINDLLKEYDIPYSHIKAFKKVLSDESKARIAAYSPIDQILWWYEDLMGPEVDNSLSLRIDQEKEPEINLPDGKLMERLLTLKMIREGISLTNVDWDWDEISETLSKRERKPDPTKAPFFTKLIPVAEKRLQQIKLPLESPIIVMGDRSGSMDIAIRTSTIIASLLTAITNAKLVFFNTENTIPQRMPTTVEEALEMAVSIEADAATSPAASLYPFYEAKEVVKTFIIVTDEEENEPFKGYNFIDLYKMYYEEVHPAQLVFVSFLPNQHDSGKMVTELKQNGFKPMQFKFNASKPDLTKLDKLFGILSSKTGSFEEQLVHIEQSSRDSGMKSLMRKLNISH